jgi:lysophospholipase L1-like esterase
LAGGHQVIFVSQPFLHARHVEQQREAAAMMTRMFGTDSRVQYLNLGGVIDLSDPAMSFDHMHLTAAGNQRLTDRLVQPIAAMAARGSTSTSAPH